jgi:mono/diheme cytochrome c family protein
MMRQLNLLLAGAFAAVSWAATPAAHAQSAKPAVADLGARTYAANCAACHQENGRGVAGAFPPLAGHAANLLAQAGGRGYLIRVLLFGLEGAITVNGTSFAGAMPAWNALDDNAIAAVLNHVVAAWDNKPRLPADFKPFAANEITAARAERMSSALVYALRQKLFASQPTTGANAPAAVALSFTEAQAAQGRSAYEHSCMDCHGSTLDNGEFGGAPLRGAYFRNKWGNGSVANLYAYMQNKMPPDRPGALSDKVYADLVAYVLKANGYEPGGRELPTDPQAQQAMSLKRD